VKDGCAVRGAPGREPGTVSFIAWQAGCWHDACWPQGARVAMARTGCRVVCVLPDGTGPSGAVMAGLASSACP